MNLDSARELKLSLKEKLLGNLVTTVRARSALGESARSLSTSGETPPTLALGVARRARKDFALAVRIQQRALERSREVELITQQAKGELDVRYIGLVEKRAAPWHRQRQRPLRIGCSVGHFNVTAGTLGAFVHPRGGGPTALLSNNHVLANENRGKKGDAILQPGALDNGQNSNDVVATLAEFIRLKRAGANLVDAATATLSKDIDADFTKLTGLGKLKGVGDVFVV